MPEIDMIVALWNRDTGSKQTGFNPDRLRLLNDALRACQSQFGTILKPSQKIKGLFLAPEYYFACENAGQVARYGSLNERCLTETGKDFIVQSLLTVSKTYPQILLIPGTVAWKKSLIRTPGQEFKRDPQTYQRTNIAKTRPGRIPCLTRSIPTSRAEEALVDTFQPNFSAQKFAGN
jgi:hypothetical protein